MPDVPELVGLLYRADWTRLSLSARATMRRDKAVHRRLRRPATEQQVEEQGPISRFMLPLDDRPYDGPDWPLHRSGSQARVRGLAAQAIPGSAPGPGCDGWRSGHTGQRPGQAGEGPLPPEQLDRLEQGRPDAPSGDRDPQRPGERGPGL